MRKKNVKCRCIGRKKNLSIFVREEKKSKCPKKNFQSVKKGGREKKYKCGISGVREKKELKGKYRREKKSKCFGGRFLSEDYC